MAAAARRRRPPLPATSRCRHSTAAIRRSRPIQRPTAPASARSKKNCASNACAPRPTRKIAHELSRTYGQDHAKRATQDPLSELAPRDPSGGRGLGRLPDALLGRGRFALHMGGTADEALCPWAGGHAGGGDGADLVLAQRLSGGISRLARASDRGGAGRNRGQGRATLA